MIGAALLTGAVVELPAADEMKKAPEQQRVKATKTRSNIQNNKAASPESTGASSNATDKGNEAGKHAINSKGTGAFRQSTTDATSQRSHGSEHAISTKGTGVAGRSLPADGSASEKHAISTKGTGASGRSSATPSPTPTR